MNLDFLKQGEAYSRPESLPRSHPGAVFKRRVLDRANLKRSEVAERLGISEKHLSRFVNGHVSLTIEFARKLEAATNISAAAWMNYQVAYDLYKTSNTNACKDIKPLFSFERPQFSIA
jgi:addiction module HigA family antidote